MKSYRLIGAILLATVVAGCTGKQSGPKTTGGAKPALMEVAVIPERPRVGERIEARVDLRAGAGEPATLAYQWLRNGTPVPGAGSRIFETGAMKKGDKVSVVVRIQGQEGEMKSQTLTLLNTPPRIATVSVTPARPGVSQELSASVKAEDHDGDPLSYQYQWSVNGLELTGATLPSLKPGAFKRGDQVAVSAVASDGEGRSEKVPSFPVFVSGRSPVILSQPPAGGIGGGTFSYQVVGQDPEGGAVGYTLVSGPSGMRMDPRSGLLTWSLPETRGGTYPVTVRVSNQDGYTDQSFTLRY